MDCHHTTTDSRSRLDEETQEQDEQQQVSALCCASTEIDLSQVCKAPQHTLARQHSRASESSTWVSDSVYVCLAEALRAERLGKQRQTTRGAVFAMPSSETPATRILLRVPNAS